MRTLSLLVLIGIAFSGQECLAQHSFGYGFLGGTFGNRGIGGAFRYGVGGEWVAAERVTIGAEVGGMEKRGSGVVASANATYHIPVRSYRNRLDPFVTGGVSIGCGRGSDSERNFAAIQEVRIWKASGSSEWASCFGDSHRNPSPQRDCRTLCSGLRPSWRRFDSSSRASRPGAQLEERASTSVPPLNDG
jgi:hypothetical protein